MVKGSDVSRKVLVIFGTVHLVLPDGSKLTCNHIKLEARTMLSSMSMVRVPFLVS